MNVDFEKAFEQITSSLDAHGCGYPPYQWQIDLFEEWRGGTFRPIAIPTGLGKTSVMVVWLLALASQASNDLEAVSLPRRFVMVVDRRTVVDQATEVAEGILNWLDANHDHPVAIALASLASKTHLPSKHPVSISTLRGERADNGEWKRDPARPAIIIGTVYKIGSRLLFWGDGDGRSMRSMHAGLLGQDVLLVHDEAHLSPAFAKLLGKIHRVQQHWPALKPFHSVELTATPSSTNGDALRLPEVDRSNPAVAKRLRANKILSLRELGDDVTPAAKRAAIVEQALTHAEASKTVLIYVTSPEEASSIASELRKQARQCDVLLLTGTLRGHERDQLAQKPIFRRFLRRHEVPHTTYLVSTSAGAVGIDLDADAAVFDLCTLDNFIQRAGRINRSGGDGRVAPIVLIYACTDFAKLDGKGRASEVVRSNLHKTLELLRQLPANNDGLDASPDALTNLVTQPSYREACEPLPRMRGLEEYLLDTWSMTAVKPRVGPEVAPWLRGLSADLPQTTLVWRDLPQLGRSAGDDQKQIDAWLCAYPVRVAEKSSIRTDRARKFFEALAVRHGDTADAARIPVVSAYGDVTTLSLTKLAAPSSRLAEATVIVPAKLGGLSADGFPDPTRIEPVLDVADQPGARERWHLSLNDGKWVATRAGQVLQLDAETFDQATNALEKQCGLRTAWLDIIANDPDDAEDVTVACIYLVARRPAFPDDGESGAQSVKTQVLDKHLRLVGASARAIGEALGLDSTLIDQLTQAGAAHDRGKDRPWWQQAAGNFSDEILAKCYGRRANWRRLHGYRHEFGSLLDLNDQGVDDELVLHLVASHHGRARPGFAASAFDNQHALAQNEQANLEAKLRFDRLQRRYGWWGLAYLEALLKCADVMGSKEASE